MIGALLMLAQIAPVAAEPKPIETTIAAIRADPSKFDGQVVRVHGWVNRCQRLSCSIDERAATAPQGAGLHLSIAANDKFDQIVGPLLPTLVEFDARVSAACLMTEVCLDRAPDLSITKLRGVISAEPPEIEK